MPLAVIGAVLASEAPRALALRQYEQSGWRVERDVPEPASSGGAGFYCPLIEDVAFPDGVIHVESRLPEAIASRLPADWCRWWFVTIDREVMVFAIDAGDDLSLLSRFPEVHHINFVFSKFDERHWR